MYGNSTVFKERSRAGLRRAAIVATAVACSIVCWRAVQRCADTHVYIPAAGHLQPGVEIYDTDNDIPLGAFLRYSRTWLPPDVRVADVVLLRQSDGSYAYHARDDMARCKVRSNDPCLAHPCPPPEITKQWYPPPVGPVPWADYVLPRGRLHPGVLLWKGKPPAPLDGFGVLLCLYDSPAPKHQAGEPDMASVAMGKGPIVNIDRKSIEESGEYWIHPYDTCSDGGFEVYCEGFAEGASLDKRPAPVAKKR